MQKRGVSFIISLLELRCPCNQLRSCWRDVMQSAEEVAKTRLRQSLRDCWRPQPHPRPCTDGVEVVLPPCSLLLCKQVVLYIANQSLVWLYRHQRVRLQATVGGNFLARSMQSFELGRSVRIPPSSHEAVHAITLLHGAALLVLLVCLLRQRCVC